MIDEKMQLLEIIGGGRARPAPIAAIFNLTIKEQFKDDFRFIRA